MSLNGSAIHIGIMNGCQKGRTYLSNVGYQSSSTYLTLPDTLRASFPLGGQTKNVKQALPSEFHDFISQFVEEFEEVDTSVWPIHQRWRVINACLAGDLLALSEVSDGYRLEVLDVPEVEPVHVA